MLSKLTQNTIYNFVGQSTAVVLGLVAVKLIYGTLGAEKLGFLYFGLMINSLILSVIDKGVYSPTVREVAASRGNVSPELVSFLQFLSFLTFWIIFLLAVVVYAIIPILIRSLFEMGDLLYDDLTIWLRVLTISSLISLASSFFGSTLRGLQKMGYPNLIDVGISVFQQIGILLILTQHTDFFVIIMWVSFTYVLKAIVYLVVCSQFFPLFVFMPKFSFSVFKRQITFIRDMIAVGALASLYKQVDKLSLSKLQGPEVLGYYGFVYTAVSKSTILTNAICSAAYPTLCDLEKNETEEMLFHFYNDLQRLILSLAAVVMGFVTYTAFPQFEFIFDTMTSERLFFPILLLCFGFFISSSLALPYRILLVYRKTKVAVFQDAIALLIGLPIVVFATYKFGMIGAAFGAIIYASIGSIYSVPKIYMECLRKNPFVYYLQVLRIAGIFVLTYGSVLSVLFLTENITVVLLFLTFVASTVVFVTVDVLTLPNTSRKKLRSLIRSLAANAKLFRKLCR